MNTMTCTCEVSIYLSFTGNFSFSGVFFHLVMFYLWQIQPGPPSCVVQDLPGCLKKTHIWFRREHIFVGKRAALLGSGLRSSATIDAFVDEDATTLETSNVSDCQFTTGRIWCMYRWEKSSWCTSRWCLHCLMVGLTRSRRRRLPTTSCWG